MPRTVKPSSQVIEGTIAILEKDVQAAGWPAYSVARHKNGRTTFRCAGVTAMFSVDRDDDITLAFYKPTVSNCYVPKSDLFVRENAAELIKAHIGLTLCSDKGLIPQSSADMIRKSLCFGYESKKLVPVAADWTSETDIAKEVTSYMASVQEARDARTELEREKDIKAYQLKEVGLPGLSINQDGLIIDIAKGEGKWEVELFTGEDSVSLDEKGLQALIDKLTQVKKVLNLPLKKPDISKADSVEEVESDIPLM